MKPKMLIVFIIIAVVAVGLAVWRQNVLQKAKETPPAPALGVQIYEEAKNPVKDEIPQTNPFSGAYKNPFQ